jgi:hypothetical protein
MKALSTIERPAKSLPQKKHHNLGPRDSPGGENRPHLQDETKDGGSHLTLSGGHCVDSIKSTFFGVPRASSAS